MDEKGQAIEIIKMIDQSEILSNLSRWFRKNGNIKQAELFEYNAYRLSQKAREGFINLEGQEEYSKIVSEFIDRKSDGSSSPSQ